MRASSRRQASIRAPSARRRTMERGQTAASEEAGAGSPGHRPSPEPALAAMASRRLRGRMSVHTSPMWARHSSRVPESPGRVPAGRDLAVGGPDRVLLLVVDDDEVLGLRVLLGHRVAFASFLFWCSAKSGGSRRAFRTAWRSTLPEVFVGSSAKYRTLLGSMCAGSSCRRCSRSPSACGSRPGAAATARYSSGWSCSTSQMTAAACAD